MKKKAKPKKYKINEELSVINEPLAVYRPIKILPSVMDFPYRKFEKIADRVPFTQREWATILHLSEKTLQRYAKDNKNFEGIYVERIQQMEELIKTGLETFTSPEVLYQWLKKDKPMLGIVLHFSDLSTGKGIQEHIDAMERLQQGIII
jgi:uncharacterized protein (DUF2384 family)